MAPPSATTGRPPREGRAYNDQMQLPSTQRTPPPRLPRPAAVSHRTPVSLFLLTLTLAPTAALACSGPGARAAIDMSQRIVLASLLITLLTFLMALLVPALRRRIGGKGLVGLGLCCVLHPGLFFSTLSGDCGFTARFVALGFLPLLAGLFVYLLRRKPGATAQP